MIAQISRYRMVFALVALFLQLAVPFRLAADPAGEGADAPAAAEARTDGGQAGAYAPPAARAAGEAFHAALLSRAVFLQDREGALSLEGVLDRSSDFTPWSMGLAWRGTGAVWMRFSLAGMDGLPERAWLCLGTQTAGGDEAWISRDGQNWTRAEQRQYASWLLDTGQAREVMVRMRATPGLWFSPRISAVEESPGMPEWLFRMGSVTILGLLAVLCLLLSMSGRSDGHLWTGLLAAASAVQIWFSVPASGGQMGWHAVCCAFSGGMALMLLPHVGRAVMSTGRTAPRIDIFFMILALPGAVLALLPLAPSCAWLARLLVLWPLLAALCFLPAFALVFHGVRGSLHFSAGCVLFFAGSAAALYGLHAGIGGEWPLAFEEIGVIAGLVLMAASSPRREAAAEEADVQDLPLLQEEPAGAADSEAEAALARVRGSVEKMLDASCRLDQSLSRAGIGEEKADIVIHADAMVAAARGIAEDVRALPPEEPLPQPEDSVFDLRAVIQKTFGSVHEEAEAKGLGLAWYVSPCIGRKFSGDAASLNALLKLLMADAVRASSSGAVSLRVRRLESSTHPGHLMFRIADSGQGRPPRGRHSLLLARLWELVSSHGGELMLDSGPQGTSVSFSMTFDALEDDGATVKSAPGMAAPEGSGEPGIIILAAGDGLRRQIWANFLDGLGYRVWEAGSALETVRLYAAEPAALVIFHGGLDEDGITRAIAGIRMAEGERSLPPVPFLLLGSDRAQAARLADAGCGHWLPLPAVRKDLRAMARWLATTGGNARRPALFGEHAGTAGEPLVTDEPFQEETAGTAQAGDGSAAVSEMPAVLPEIGGSAADRDQTPPEPPVQAADHEEKEDNAGVQPEVVRVEADPADSLPLEEGHRVDPLVLDDSEKKASGGWLSTVFGAGEAQGQALELLPEQPREEDPSGDIVELSREQAVAPAAEEGAAVVDLAPEDMVAVQNGDGSAGGVVELSPAMAEGSAPAGAGEDARPEGAAAQKEAAEDMEDPAGLLLAGVRRIEEALEAQDSAAMMAAAEDVSVIAGAYGIRTLADMALCVREACASGDRAGAAQAVQDMRAELERTVQQ